MEKGGATQADTEPKREMLRELQQKQHKAVQKLRELNKNKTAKVGDISPASNDWTKLLHVISRLRRNHQHPPNPQPRPLQLKLMPSLPLTQARVQWTIPPSLPSSWYSLLHAYLILQQVNELQLVGGRAEEAQRT